MKNKRSVYVNFTKLSSYIKKCFKDAYESLELPFNENSIETEYILIEDHAGTKVTELDLLGNTVYAIIWKRILVYVMEILMHLRLL